VMTHGVAAAAFPLVVGVLTGIVAVGRRPQTLRTA